LRDYEERRFMAEEAQVQTEMQGKDIISMMQQAMSNNVHGIPPKKH
jgi:hypothetical protein